MSQTPKRNMNEPQAVERLLTTSEAAELLGVSQAFLANLRVAGDGPSFFKLGRAVRYSRDQLFEWAESRSRRSTAG